VKEKRTKTCRDKYGVNHHSQAQEVKNKKKETSQEHYGTDHPFQNEQVKEKMLALWQEKYRTTSPLAVPEVQEKCRHTLKERYGVEATMHHPEFKAKAWTTRLADPRQTFSSHAEKELLEWVRQYHPSAAPSHTGDYQIDVLIPEVGLAIEYNGLWWHSEGTGKHRTYHTQKRDAILKTRGANTVFVWEHEWRDRREQVEGYLLSRMGMNWRKLGARKCSFREIDRVTASVFLELYHIQGKSHIATFFLGCFSGEELLAVAAFGIHHRGPLENVLTRFVCKCGVTISGALSKMSKIASVHFKTDIVTWADKCKSAASGYEAAGWQVDGDLPPDYFYIHKSHTGVPISKQSRQKSKVNTPEGMTEAEHAAQDGLIRVWDCGKVRLRYRHAV
jgi:hypothetical protein